MPIKLIREKKYPQRKMLYLVPLMVRYDLNLDKKITYYAKPAEPVNEKVDEKTTEV